MITGTGAAILTLIVPLDVLLDLVNIGTLSAFAIVCAGVLALRYSRPAAVRPFRAPFGPVVAALGCVDAVVGFSEATPERLMSRLKPDVQVKGGDYSAEQIAGGDCVRAAGGEVRVLGFVPGHSSTATIERIRQGGDAPA